MAKKKFGFVRQPEPEPRKPEPIRCGLGKMDSEELAEYQMMLTRARTFTDGRKKADKNACRGNSAGRSDQ